MSTLPLPSPFAAAAPGPGARAVCRHCQKVRALKRRGLCPRCYNSPARNLYPMRLAGSSRPPGTCVHCKEHVERIAPRSLCEKCYLTDEVRALYPPAKKPEPRAFAACRACGLVKGVRRRGLCRRCYYVYETRARFPSQSARAPKSALERGGGQGADFYGDPAPPATPTAAPPGSPEKVAVLEERARLGVGLWHRLDAAAPDDG